MYYSLIDIIKTIPNNYNNIINVVVSGSLNSLLSIRERYEKEILINNAKLSNIESHNKCCELLPNFISKCVSLGVNINYIIFKDNKYNTISIDNTNKYLLQELRDNSNKDTILNYEYRINSIKNSMVKRNAPKE